jgi:hypothetical protein
MSKNADNLVHKGKRPGVFEPQVDMLKTSAGAEVRFVCRVSGRTLSDSLFLLSLVLQMNRLAEIVAIA